MSAREATRAAQHLSECAECRRVQDELQNVRLALRGLSTPGGSQQMRERVFSRLEASVRSGEAAQSKVAGRSLRWPLLRWPVVTWQPALATAAAVAVVVGAFILIPGSEPVQINPPAASELSQLYHLHDVQAPDLSAGDPVLHHDVRAEAQAALLDEADNRVQGNL